MAHNKMYLVGDLLRYAQNTGRASLVCCMDSNYLNDGGGSGNYGYSRGFNDALHVSLTEPFALWGAGPYNRPADAANNPLFSSAVVDANIQENVATGTGLDQLADYVPTSSYVNAGFLCVANGATVGAGQRAGMRTSSSPASYIGLSDDHTWKTYHEAFKFTGVGGTLDTGWREASTLRGQPEAIFSTGFALSNSIETISIEVDGSTVTGTRCEFIRNGRGGITGPAMWMNNFYTVPTRTTGLCTTAWWYKSGGTAIDCNTDLAAEGTTIKHGFFNCVRTRQLGDGQSTAKLLVPIHLGGNDWPGESAANVKTAIEGIISDITTQWVAIGGSTDEIVFLLMGYHPRTSSDNYGYRDTLAEISSEQSNVAYYDPTAEFTTAEMVSNAYYDGGGGDNAHLSVAGYNALSLRLFEVALNSFSQNALRGRRIRNRLPRIFR